MADLKEQIRNLPNNPGVYKYFDSNDKPLYFGKARDLRKRVASYFTLKADQSYRIRLMVSKIARIEFTIVASEYDALLLENSLIKKYQPRYNVSLRDDKTYPFIIIKNERFPRLYPTRLRSEGAGEYFGPYASVSIMRGVLEFIRKLFPTRSCHFALTDENIKAHKFKVCLDFHIKLCKGPCEALQTEEDYSKNIDQIRNILKGNSTEAMKYLRVQLQKASSNLEFEQAQEYKNKIDLLESFQARSTVVNPLITNVDVFSIFSNDKIAFINFLRVVNGAIIMTDTIEVRKRLDEPDPEILALAIADLRMRYKSGSMEAIVPIPMPVEMEGLNFTIPQIGDKKKLLELSKKNAYAYFQNKLRATELNKQKRKHEEVLTKMKDDLNLKAVPYHIECIDNSNIQGSFPVSALVVFKNGVPSKKDYRHFNIRTVDQPDDFATMEEVVKRRYKRLLEQNEPLPQLIIIDGGKGQLSAAIKSLRELNLLDKVDIIGIAKRLEEIYKPGDPIPLSINKKSQTLRIIQQARDEAHRFGVTHHRKRRQNANLRSSIEDIRGIGKKTAEKLINHFKSVKKLKEASAEEMEKVVGKARTAVVLKALNESPG
ncbi:MAG: excinuclease ABC subunit UvrC [Bacteroidota bacterium]|nr:excinuclease ABC subunit UvrC [Bacteroidota bacterium]